MEVGLFLAGHYLLPSLAIDDESIAACYGPNTITIAWRDICWLKAAPLRHHRLFRFGEIALSDQEYAAFTQQLAALLMEKTGLPLYDLRC